MTTQAKKTVQANYSQEMITAIVAEYQTAIVANNGDNKIVLSILSEKYGKTVPSLRAKLASLKVYQSDKKGDEKTPLSSDVSKSKKEDIAQAISNIVGQDLQGLDVAPKNSLLTLLAFLLKANKLLQEKEDKINALIAEMLAENEPVIYDDLNDND